MIHAGLAACDADRLVEQALRLSRDPEPVWLLAAGKAAPAMATAAARLLGERLRGGLVIASARAEVDPRLETIVAGHPVPNEASERAGRRALALVQAARPGERLLFLLSGGASALMAVPAEGLTLADKRATTELLLRSGTDIHGLNVVRKHLSAVKGGRLAAAATVPATTLAISDVVGDDLSVIASGPTVGDASCYGDALQILERSGVELAAYPERVVSHLRRGRQGGLPETPDPGNSVFADGSAAVIGSRLDAMRGAAAEARRLGYDVITINTPVVGEARVAAHQMLDEVLTRAAETASRAAPLCVVASGETTVRVTGGGRGGRNQEFALALVDRLGALHIDLVAASVGTDGVDGPTDSAGAIVDVTTMLRADRARLLPEAFLTNNDAQTFFAELGDLVKTGPTGTNVGDLQIFLLA